MREARLTNKDMSVLREADSAYEQHRSVRGTLKDYSMKHRVSMEWDLNDDSIKDRIFRLKIDEIEVLLDWEEVIRLGRWI